MTWLSPAYEIFPPNRIEQAESNLKCRFTPLSLGNHTYVGKNCVVESAAIGCNVRIEDGCVLVRLDQTRLCIVHVGLSSTACLPVSLSLVQQGAKVCWTRTGLGVPALKSPQEFVAHAANFLFSA